MNIQSDDSSNLASFLLVEDDEDHAYLVGRSLANNHVVNRITRVRDGAEALDFLFGRAPYESRVLPDAILLDLKLPKVDGHEVLRQIKSDARLSMIPVVVLTTSAAESDRTRAYQERANSYLVKPLDFESFRRMANDLNLYWGVWNQSPFQQKDV